MVEWRVCKNSNKSGLKAQYLYSPGQRPGYKVFTDNAPCKGNSIWHNRVALTGRMGCVYPYTQGVALGCGDIGLSARFFV